MKTIGNIIWIALAGVWAALGWLLVALVLAITIIGLPFARQCVKLAHLSLWPFGRTTIRDPTARVPSPIGNVFWVILAGWWLALSYIVGGILCCITIIGIPFGLQGFKLAGLAFAPFGRRVVKTNELVPASSIPATYARPADGWPG